MYEVWEYREDDGCAPQDCFSPTTVYCCWHCEEGDLE